MAQVSRDVFWQPERQHGPAVRAWHWGLRPLSSAPGSATGMPFDLELVTSPL